MVTYHNFRGSKTRYIKIGNYKFVEDDFPKILETLLGAGNMERFFHEQVVKGRLAKDPEYGGCLCPADWINARE